MEIRRVYVDPEWQGRGIGSTLIETALQSADLRTASAVEIDVWEANANARRLYERFGFIATDRRVAFRNGRGEVSGYDVVLERWRGA